MLLSIAKVEELSRWEAVKGQGTVSEESRGRILMKTREGSKVEVEASIVALSRFHPNLDAGSDMEGAKRERELSFGSSLWRALFRRHVRIIAVREKMARGTMMKTLRKATTHAVDIVVNATWGKKNKRALTVAGAPKSLPWS